MDGVIMKEKYYQGSYTVEAALLMPLVLAVIFFVLYLSFLSYDSLRLSFVLRETALWGSMRIEQGIEVTQELLITKAKSQQILLLNLRNVNFRSEIKNDKIIMSYTSETFFLKGGGKTKDFEVAQFIHRPETVLRIAHLITGKEEKDGD